MYDIRSKDITKPSPSKVEVDIDIEDLEQLGQLQRVLLGCRAGSLLKRRPPCFTLPPDSTLPQKDSCIGALPVLLLALGQLLRLTLAAHPAGLDPVPTAEVRHWETSQMDMHFSSCHKAIAARKPHSMACVVVALQLSTTGDALNSESLQKLQQQQQQLVKVSNSMAARPPAWALQVTGLQADMDLQHAHDLHAQHQDSFLHL